MRTGFLAPPILSLLGAFHAARASEVPPPPGPAPATWTAQNSDPRTLGWMKGAPPPEDKIIRSDGGFFDFPKMRWSVCHFQQLMPSRPVSRGLAASVPLREALRADLDALPFTPTNGTGPITWAQALEATFTDGILVIHRNAIVYERYFGCLEPSGKHAAMSMTKSLIGLLAEVLVTEGRLDEKARMATYVPELAGSAFGDATVRQVMDMTTGLDYSEDYADPKAGVWLHAAAGSPLPKPKDYQGPRSYFEFLQTVQKKGEHGPAFGYKTVNTDALGWVLARVSGQSVADLLSQRLWARMGAEQDAFFTVDSIGTPFAGGGLNAGLRDMGRVGWLLLNDGVLNGQRILPKGVVSSIQGGGSQEAFKAAGYSGLPGWSYRSMWWVTHNDHGAYMARGVHGQSLYIDPKAQMVIVRFASHPVAGNAANDPVTLPAYHAMARHLMTSPRQMAKKPGQRVR